MVAVRKQLFGCRVLLLSELLSVCHGRQSPLPPFAAASHVTPESVPRNVDPQQPVSDIEVFLSPTRNAPSPITIIDHQMAPLMIQPPHLHP